MSDPPRRRMPLSFWLLLAILAAIVVVVVAGGPVLGLAADDFASVGYLVAILLFVGAALIGRNLKARDVVRSIASWLVIFLALIAAYAYRGDIAEVGGRMLGVLAPGVPIAGRLVGDVGEGSVVVIRGRDGHFAVRAQVDDTPLTLLVDTGASFVTLTMADAAGVGVDVNGLEFATPIRTANGVIQAARITIDRLAVGAIERRALKALVAPPNSLDQSLLGMSFLNTLAGYGISGDRLVLSD